MKPSAAKVLRLLEAHPEGVTPLQALYEAGTYRLSARLGELRALGYRISARNAGDGVWIYRLEDRAPTMELSA